MNKYTFLGKFDHKESISDVKLVLKHISDPKIQDGRQLWMENRFF